MVFVWYADTPDPINLPTSHHERLFLGSSPVRTDAHELMDTSYASLHLRPRPHLVASNGVRPAAVTLLSNGELDTLTLGQRDPWLLLSDDADAY
mgnify:CR=1 FL=1